jgi:hypothetical protein
MTAAYNHNGILYKEILLLLDIYFCPSLAMRSAGILMPVSEFLLGKGGHHACWHWRVVVR